jgi:cell division protein FtsA
LNRGVVVNIEKTTRAIKNVVEQAEQQSGIKITDVNIGIAGDHIESIQSRGVITINNPTYEISAKDVERLLDEARKIAVVPNDRQILHLLPQDFIIDNQDGIQDPVGMSGQRLEAQVHIITGLKSAIKNIVTCVERAGLRVQSLVLEPIASGKAVLSEEEKEVGVAIVDIGGGTTDIAVYADKIIRYTSVFGIAGNQITSDLQQGLGITLANAEKVKRENGHTFTESIAHDEPIMIPGIPGRKPQEVSKVILCQILQPRMKEIFEFVAAELHNSGFISKISAGGVVITGGSTLLRGTDLLAQEILNMPVRIGIPTGITYAGLAPEIESPVYATAVGLALWGIENAVEMKIDDASAVNTTSPNTNIDIKNGPYKLPQKEEKSAPVSQTQNFDSLKKPQEQVKDWLGKLKDTLKNL